MFLCGIQKKNRTRLQIRCLDTDQVSRAGSWAKSGQVWTERSANLFWGSISWIMDRSMLIRSILWYLWSIFDPQGLGFGQKFALLERGWSRSKLGTIPWHPMETTVAKSGLETAANGLVKEANLDFARTWRRQVTDVTSKIDVTTALERRFW